MANRSFTQFTSSFHKKLVLFDCNFIVDSTNGNGYGARSLKGAGINKIFMNTTASFTGTVASSSPNITAIASGTTGFEIGAQVAGTGIPAGTFIVAILSGNSVQMSANATGNHISESITYVAPNSPNPAAGLIYVNFQDNWNYYYGGYSGFVSPVSGTPISISTGSSLTVGHAYVIVSLGTSTTANWVAVGVPVGVTPQVGTAFIASATSGTGTGIVEATVYSGIDHIEVIGDPNTTITSQQATVLGGGGGAYMILQCFNAGSLTAPTNGTTIGMSFAMSNSYIKVKGD